MKVLPVIIDETNPKIAGKIRHGDIFTIESDESVPNYSMVKDKKFIAVPKNYLESTIKAYWQIKIEQAN